MSLPGGPDAAGAGLRSRMIVISPGRVPPGLACGKDILAPRLSLHACTYTHKHKNTKTHKHAPAVMKGCSCLTPLDDLNLKSKMMRWPSTMNSTSSLWPLRLCSATSVCCTPPMLTCPDSQRLSGLPSQLELTLHKRNLKIREPSRPNSLKPVLPARIFSPHPHRTRAVHLHANESLCCDRAFK